MADQSYGVVFEQIVADVDAEMRAIRADQSAISPIMWEIVDYQFGWDLTEPEGAKKSAGKKIRPVLMALVAKAIAGRYEHVLPAAASLEFLHNFTLIHDDVMDRSEERRHRPAVWTRWGQTQAINAGDGLYALANLAIVRLLQAGIPAEKAVTAFETLSRACLWTAEGQMLDIDFETRAVVSPEEYITMITNKSATLIEAAARIGALLSTDDQAVVDAYTRFGRNLGVAFQVRDDYLGVWGDEVTTGKSTVSDIREKKKAYPVLVGFERASREDLAELCRIYALDTLSEGDIERVLAILDRAQAAEQTDAIAQEYYDAALNHLALAGLENETQNLIRHYAMFLIRRDY
jgi:geranylgeranyl diphosphate synthase type I